MPHATPAAPETPAEFRAAIAYHGLMLYRLAPLVDLHPSRLSRALHGRDPLTRDLAARLWRAIQEQAAE